MKDRYEIQEKIGQGGIGAVYRAYDTHLKREVAIKRMLPDEKEVKGEQSTEIILKEATTLSALQHPNVVTVYDFGIDEEGAFVVMELLKGETLDQVIQRGVLTLKDFSEVVHQTLEALIAAEAVGVVHRDLKPTNVMVNWLPSKKFQVKILDFGLAKFSTAPTPQTVDHGDSIMGSIYFMAPEQFERANLDKRTDLYSMGCLYYFALAGHYPFQGENAAQVMAAHLQGQVIPLEQIRPDLPALACQWVMWLINRYPTNRPGDAREAFDSYQQILLSLSMETGPAPSMPLSQPAPQPPKNTTSRRLIIPPSPTSPQTPQVPPVTTKQLSFGEKLTPAATPVVPEKSNRTMVVMLVSLAALFAIAAAITFWLLNNDNRQNLEEARFQALVKNANPSGGAVDVRFLASYLDGITPSVSLAQSTLTKLKSDTGESIDEAIILELKKSSDRKRFNLLNVIRDRRMVAAGNALVELLDESKNGDLHGKVMETIGMVGGPALVPALLKRVTATDLEPDLIKAIDGICGRVNTPAMLEGDIKTAYFSLSDSPGKNELLGILSLIGSEAALEEFGRLYKIDETHRKVVLKALHKWPEREMRIAALLEGVLHSSESTPVETKMAVQAYLRLATLKAGTNPTHEAMFDQLGLFLMKVNGQVDFDPYIPQYLVNLATFDKSWALPLARKFAESKISSPTILEQANRAIEYLEKKPAP